MDNRPITTLFMLMSVDGKISSGASDIFDADKDWRITPGVREGLYQYYQIEETTDLWSLNTGRGKNRSKWPNDVPKKIPCNFIIIDAKK